MLCASKRVFNSKTEITTSKVEAGSVAAGRRFSHLATHEECVRDTSYKTETHFVVDDIADERSLDSILGFRQKLMAVMPCSEWTFVLDVGKVAIPFKLGDASDPLCANRQKWKHEPM